MFRHVARISSRRGQPGMGPRCPLPKTENSSDLVHYFLGRGQFIFYFLIFTIKFNLFFRSEGGHGPGAPMARATYVVTCGTTFLRYKIYSLMPCSIPYAVAAGMPRTYHIYVFPLSEMDRSRNRYMFSVTPLLPVGRLLGDERAEADKCAIMYDCRYSYMCAREDIP